MNDMPFKNSKKFLQEIANEFEEATYDECEIDDIDITSICEITEESYMPTLASDIISEYESQNISDDDDLPRRVRVIKNFPWKDLADIKRKRVDIKKAEEILNIFVSGQQKAKSKIIELIALYNRSSIAAIKPMIFVGPPGTGKSTTAKVIANILERPAEILHFPAIVEAWEIIGSNKGWRNADFGYITRAISRNKKLPIFIFEDIDKTEQENTHRTSPMKALISILGDRENFVDPFLEVPYSLKHAFFIMTANDITEIPETVKSHAQIIHFSGFNKNEERLEILEKYIFPSLYKNYILTKEEFTPSKTIIDYILSSSVSHTGGVREMEKCAEKVFTRAVYLLETTGQESINLSLSDLGENFQQKMVFKLTAKI